MLVIGKLEYGNNAEVEVRLVDAGGEIGGYERHRAAILPRHGAPNGVSSSEHEQ